MAHSPMLWRVPPEVEEGAMVAEVGHLAGVEPYLDEADTKAVCMEDDFCPIAVVWFLFNCFWFITNHGTSDSCNHINSCGIAKHLT